MLGKPHLRGGQRKSVARDMILRDGVPASMLHGDAGFAYIAPRGEGEKQDGVLLRRNGQKGVMVALLVVKGRVRRGSPLMTIPLAEIECNDGARLRNACAWGAWLVSTVTHK